MTLRGLTRDRYCEILKNGGYKVESILARDWLKKNGCYTMKEYFSCRFSRDGEPIYGNYLPEGVFDDLVIAFPEGLVRPDYFQIELEARSERLGQLFDFLDHFANLRPRLSKVQIGSHKRNRTFAVRGRRVFDADDIEMSSFCLLMAPKDMGDNSYLKDKRPCFERQDLMLQLVGHGGNYNETFCGDAMMKKIQGGGFSGVEFREVVVTGRGREKKYEPIWQLWSSHRLPPMQNEKLDREGKLIEHGESECKGCYLNDIYFPPLINYSSISLEAVGELDLVASFEYFGHTDEKWRRVPYLFASTRLRKWLIQQKIAFEFYPVVFGSKEESD